MWARRSHKLAPLTKLMSTKVKLRWNKTEQEVFKEIMRTVARNVLLAYPDFNKYFKIHTNARKSQLRAIISQEVKPLAFIVENQSTRK